MKVVISGHSKEGHVYLIRLHTDKLINRTRILIKKNRREAIKYILAYGQLENLIHPNAISRMDADMIINREAIYWNLKKK